MISNRFNWYAIQTRVLHENKVVVGLQNKDIECFLPVNRQRRRWADRAKVIEVPLFPGYLFARFDANVRLPVLTTPGVFFIVGNGGGPAPIPDEEITSIQTLVRSQAASEPWPYMRVGQRVRIEDGPFAGLNGFLVRNKKSDRIVVSVSLIERSVAVEIDVSQVIAEDLHKGPEVDYQQGRQILSGARDGSLKTTF